MTTYVASEIFIQSVLQENIIATEHAKNDELRQNEKRKKEED